MTSINIIFDLPEHVIKGIQSGELERVGGVVRKKGSKKLVMWLSEAGDKTTEASRIPTILQSPEMLMGLQVANLAVSVAGFAIIYRKLQQVERQLQGISEKLESIAESQSWLDKKQLMGNLAPVMASAKTLESIHRLEDQTLIRDKVRSADDRLDVASIYFHQLLGQMLAERMERDRPDEFAACYRAWLVASQARVQTMAELDEIREAHHRAEAFKVEHKLFGQDFINVRRDPLRKFRNDHASEVADQILVQLGQQCAGAHEIVKGKALQLKHMKDNNVKMADLVTQALPDESQYIVYQLE